LAIPPPVAVTVTVELQIVAELDADNFNVLLPLPGAAIVAGLKLAVTPDGSPMIDNPIEALNPAPGVAVRVTWVVPPRDRLALERLLDSVKVGAGTSPRLIGRVLVTPPPFAVIVSVKAPVAAVEAAASVKVLLPLPGEAMLAGAKPAVTPAGNPLTDKLIEALNPAVVAVVSLMEPDLPNVTLMLVALAASVMFGGGSTVRVKVIVLVAPPPPTAPSVR